MKHILVGLIGLSFSAVTAQAVLIASDDFATTTTSGTGWATDWSVDKGTQTNLTYTGLPTSGDAVGGSGGNAFRTLASAQTVGTIYISALFLSNSSSGGGYANFSLLNGGNTAAEERISFGAVYDGGGLAADYGVWMQSGVPSPASFFTSSGVARTAATTLFVGELDLTGGTANFWVNPDLSLPLGSPTFSVSRTGLPNDNFAFDRVRIEADGTSVMDELRIGSQLVDVIPEPSAALLGGLGVLALLRRRRY